MKLKILFVPVAAALFSLSVNAASDDNSGVPKSSQSYPTGSTATPSGHSPGQGAGNSGSATSDFHRDAAPGTGHGASAGGSAAMFSRMDRNGDGQISQEEWNAMRGGSSAGATSGRATRGAPEPSSHAPAQ
jgi:hypothetical protein